MVEKELFKRRETLIKFYWLRHDWKDSDYIEFLNIFPHEFNFWINVLSDPILKKWLFIVKEVMS